MGEQVATIERLAGRRIVLGVTGGIAAYKAAELVRRLREAGAEVQVVMTEAATAFVTPLTFQALSGRPVHVRWLDHEAEAAMGHIDFARWADVVLIAPASADFIARLAAGMAGDLLSALSLASQAPLLVAPAMNHAMWSHPATQANLATLKSRGVTLLGPAAGEQACGEVGWGRMLEPAELVNGVAAHFAQGPLAGLRVLVTAGPTREAIDPVRYIGNRSSGKMGYAVAQACALAGASVTLVSGPVALESPRGVARVLVESAAQMREAVLAHSGDCDIFIATAAVADYRPRQAAANKIKKDAAELSLELERNADILAEVAAQSPRPFVVGFAAETEALEQHARVKLERKRLDMVAANRVGEAGTGFEADDNALLVLWPGGQTALPRAPKTELARQLINIIAERYHAPDSGQDH